MQLGEAYMFKLDKCLGFRKQFTNSALNQCQLDILLKKHRKYIKKWKEVKQMKVQMDKNCLTLAAYATADRYDLQSVLDAIQSQNGFTACELTNDVPMKTELCNALHLKSASPDGREDSHVFCFDVGTVVMWNLSHGQREEMLEFLEPFEKNRYGYNLSRSTSELLAFNYAKSKASYLHDNTLYFGVADKSSDMIGLNRFLVSCAISLSTKIAAFEGMIETNLCRMEKVAERMKAGKDLNMKQRQVVAIAGITCATKYNLKMTTDSLLLPCKLLEHFKSDDERESFANTCVYFSLPQRLELFDNNIVLCECYVNFLLNHFSYCEKRRTQKLVLTLIGVSGVGIAMSLIKKILS
ncbi:unnamed protein product [Nezara viridula]|uniref:DUF155 domain-containing protein n=1 Tax=Nezara viridula TaxID=85310 RepID=A0A9P0HQZ3_NEZVI|nr:unnamed protein product [Nezara viridula]